jgi:hypothetical protein
MDPPSWYFGVAHASSVVSGLCSRELDRGAKVRTICRPHLPHASVSVGSATALSSSNLPTCASLETPLHLSPQTDTWKEEKAASGGLMATPLIGMIV